MSAPSPSAVIAEVAKGNVELKHAETKDKSAPVIECKSLHLLLLISSVFNLSYAADTHVKTVDRKPFLQEVSKDHELKHVDAVADRSEPSIFTSLILPPSPLLSSPPCPLAHLLQLISFTLH